MNYLFDKVLIKEQMKRYWTVGVLIFLGYLMFVLMPLWNTDSDSQQTVLSILLLRNPFVLICNIVAPLAASSLMFSHMYKPSAAVAVYSMPFSRKKIFASNVLAGFLLMAIPLFIFSALLLVYKVDLSIISPFPSSLVLDEIPYGTTINTIPNVAMFFLRTLLSYTYYYLLFTTAAMIVGNSIMHLLVSALLAFIVQIVALGFGAGASFIVFGYFYDSYLVGQIAVYTNPILIGALEEYENGTVSYILGSQNLTACYLVYMAIMAALVALSAWLHQRRRLECTADMVVFAPIKQFLVFMTSVTGMLFMGTFFSMLFNGHLKVVCAGLIVGFVLAFYVAQMITEKAFNVFYRMKWILVHGLAFLAVIALFNAINVFNIGGYVKYVPNSQDVYGVRLSTNFNYKPYNDNMFIQDPYMIEETISAHKAIIENRRDFRNASLARYRGQTYKSINPNTVKTQHISYMMKDGSVVTREYVLSKDMLEQIGLQKLLNETTVALSDIYWTKNPQTVERLNFTMYKSEENNTAGQANNDTYVYTNVTKPLYVNGTDHMKALSEAINKDYIISKREEERLQGGAANYLNIVVSLSGSGFEYVSLYYYENTLKCLDENGYSFNSSVDGETIIQISKKLGS